MTVGEPPPGTWTLRPADACWVLEPPAIELTPTGIAPAELLVLDELIGPGTRPAGRNGRASVAVAVAQSSPAVGCGADDVGIEPEWDVMIRVFGLVDVVDRAGHVASFTKSKALELLAWLGTHREQATRLGARSALWEIDVRDATFANVVSEARRGLGRLVSPPPEQDWVGRSSASLPLHERMITDVDLIESRLARVAHQSDVSAISTLRSAVALIRGVPFAESGYLWPEHGRDDVSPRHAGDHVRDGAGRTGARCGESRRSIRRDGHRSPCAPRSRGVDRASHEGPCGSWRPGRDPPRMADVRASRRVRSVV